MSTLTEALDQFREHCRTRAHLTAAYMRGEVSPQDIHAWDMENPVPQCPTVEQPSLVWLHRPEDLPNDNYSPYDLLYKPVFDVGGRKWRRGTGRSAENSSTRFGRLDYPECKRRARAYFTESIGNTQTWRHETYTIQREEGAKALATVPHKKVKSENGYYTYAFILLPYGQYLILEGHEGTPPALGTWGSDTGSHPPRKYLAMIDEGVRKGLSREEARAEADRREREEAPNRLIEMLVGYGVRKSDVEEALRG